MEGKQVRLCVRLNGPIQALDRSRQTAKGIRFDNEKNTANKKKISHLFREAALEKGVKLPLEPGEMGYSISISVWYGVPQTTTKANLELIREYKKLPQTKPDIDNIAKLWLDALTQGGIIKDDKCVTRLSVNKRYDTEPWVLCSLEVREDFSK